MLNINDPRFRDLISRVVPIENLERRLRPELGLKNYGEEKREHDNFGDFSTEGFLGKDESLLGVVHEDWKRVESYGTNHKEIAEALAKAFKEERLPNSEFRIDHSFMSMGLQSCPWLCVGDYQRGNGIFLIYSANATEDEINIATLYVTHGRLTKKLMKDKLKGSKFLLKFVEKMPENPVDLTDKIAVVTELHPHLIEQHYFFEGRQSPYRADPSLLISALNLGSTHK